MKAEAEIKSDAATSQGLPATPGTGGQAGVDFPSKALERTHPPGPLVLDHWFPEP